MWKNQSLQRWDCVPCFGEAISFALLRSLSDLLNSSLLHRTSNGPCSDHPLGNVHSMEFGSITTGESSPLGECGTWDRERREGWNLLSALFLFFFFPLSQSFSV